MSTNAAARTRATYYDEHIPESSIEILCNAVCDITYRHYAHRDPQAFRAIMTSHNPQQLLHLSQALTANARAAEDLS